MKKQISSLRGIYCLRSFMTATLIMLFVFGANAQILSKKWTVPADATTGQCSVRTATGYGNKLFGNNYQAGTVEEWENGVLVASYDVNKFCSDNNIGGMTNVTDSIGNTVEEFKPYVLWTGSMMDDAGNLLVNVGTSIGAANTSQNWILLPASERTAMKYLCIDKFANASVTPGRIDVPSRMIGDITSSDGAYIYLTMSNSTELQVMSIYTDDSGSLIADTEFSWSLLSSQAFDSSTNATTLMTFDELLSATSQDEVAAKTYIRSRGQGNPFTWDTTAGQFAKNTAIPQGGTSAGMDVFKIGEVEYIVVPVKSATTGNRGSSVAIYNLADGTEVAAWDAASTADYFVGSVQARVNDDGKSANIYVCGYKDCIGILNFSSHDYIDSISIDKTSLTIAKSQSEKLTASVVKNDTTFVEEYIWTSSNTSVATVDAEGNVTAVGAGTATITVKVSGSQKSAKCTVTVLNADFVENGVFYSITSSVEPYTAEVIKSNYSEDIVIAESITINGINYNVTSIAYQAFYNCTNLTSVSIPSTVTSIGNYAFRGCTALQSIKLSNPTPITFDSYYIFYNLAKYNIKLYVPKGSGHAYSASSDWNEFIIIDGDEINKATVSCSTAGTLGEEILKQLEYVDIVNELTISGSLNDDDYKLIKNSMPNLTAINMQNTSAATLPNSLFSGKNKLTSAVLPSTLINTGTYTFENCSSLTDVTLPESLTTIGNRAFGYCEKLQNITIPQTVTNIGNYAFYQCKNLQNITIPQSVTYIGNSAFYYCSALKNIVIPANVTTIQNSTFSCCTALESVTLPENITSIGSSAFNGCTALTSIELPSALTSLENNAFNDCTGLTEVEIPAKVSYCGYGVFSSCTNIAKVTCYASVPPANNGSSSFDSSYGNIELFVPAWSVSEYKLKNGWNGFGKISAITDYIADIYVTEGKLAFDETTRPSNEPNVTVTPTGKLVVNGTDAFSMTSYKQQQSLEFYPYAYDHEDYDNSTYSSMISNSSTMRADSVSLDLIFADNYYQTWAFVTMPFDCNMADVKISNEAEMVIRYYDGETRAAGGASNWKDVTSDMTLNAGQGYIIQLSDTATVTFSAINNDNKNRMFSNANLSRTLNEYTSEFAHNRSWNYIGNPFQCYYDTRFLNYSSPITYYCGNSYVAVSPIDDTFILAPMQAFFVQKPLDADEITFDIEGRQLDATVRTITAQAATVSNSDRKVFDFALNDKNGACDKTRIVINQKMTMGYESSRDASKFMSDNKTIAQLYTLDVTGTRYAINERPFDNGIVKLGFYAGVEGTYTIEMPRGEYVGSKVILVDKESNTETELSNGGSYTFKSGAGYNNSRFEIVFSHNLSGIDAVSETGVTVSAGKDCINVIAPIDSEIAVYSVAGQMIAGTKAAQSTTAIPAESGIYIVEVNGKAYKVVVND